MSYDRASGIGCKTAVAAQVIAPRPAQCVARVLGRYYNRVYNSTRVVEKQVSNPTALFTTNVHELFPKRPCPFHTPHPSPIVVNRQVLVFEMVEARTPFAPPGAEQDIAQLFTNIACVKKRGVFFPSNFDGKAGGNSHCRDIISGMLAFEPGDRLGNLADG